MRFTAATVVLMLLALSLPLSLRPAAAASVSAASFSGDNKTLVVDGVLYAKKQAGLTLNVTTATAAKCVEVSGDHTGRWTSNSAKTTWSIGFTAEAGDGVKTVTVRAFDNIGTPCTNGTGNHKSMDASYVLDNTGATASASLSPAANAAGWNNSPVSIAWEGSDTGVGLTAKCTGPGSEHNPKPCTDTVTAATNGTTKTASATDRLGNAGGGSVVVRIDTQAPTITGSRSPVQPTSGWNNTDVTVSFTCDDPKQGVTKDNAGFASGIKTCGPNQTVSTSGANQSVTGKAIDAADNEVSTTVSNINIDKVAPTVTGAAATLPNADGWYQGDVSIAWTCSDPLSGLAGTCPGSSTISGEGANLGATSPSVSDKAGNSASGSVTGIKIDRTAPNTTTNATTNWNNQDVTVVLTPSDNLSEVKSTHYRLNGGAEQTGTSVPVDSEGIHTLDYWSIDHADNVEAKKTVQVKIDKTEPSISHTQAPEANGNGWNNTDVTVTFTCFDTDGGSGINSCTQPVTFTTEGQDQEVLGTAVDNAGNTATDPATVSIDKTAPTISAAADREANGNGWYKADVTVSFTCGDQLGLSGVATCPVAQTLGEGTNQSASGTATDAADNPASASVTGINVDKTAPTLTGAAQGTPTNGWYNDDVTVVWSCDDAGGSGLDGNCPGNSLVTGEGENGSASASVSDKAGNSTSAMVSDIKIDRTAPLTTATVPPGSDSWHASPVQVTLSASDNLSQVATTYYSLNDGAAQVYSGGITLIADRTHTIVFWSVDQAGNVEDAGADGHSVEVQVDNIKPSITGSVSPAANATGWYTDAPTVSFACEDAVPGSGIKHCRADGELGNSKLLGEGRDQSVSGTATDNVGNTNQSIVSGIDVDLTDPVNIQFVGGPDADGEYTVGSVPGGPTCTAEDAVSGIASCLVSGYGDSEGSHTLTATATDNAGRTATATRAYEVVAAIVAPSWTASGFYRPIDMSPAGAAPTQVIWNTAKNGSTIPFKFEVFAGPNQTNEVSDTSKVAMTAKQVQCQAGAAVDALEELASGATSIRYDSTAGQFIYNWKTPTKANTCWQMIMKANGGEAVIDSAFVMLK